MTLPSVITLNDEVGDPEQLEDEILRGAIGDGECVVDHCPAAGDTVTTIATAEKEKT